MTHRVRRGAVIVLLTGIALVVGSSPAWAHGRLTTSDPADGAALAIAPSSVSLTFNEPVQAGFTTVTVIGPDGVDYHTGPYGEVDDTVTAPVRPLVPAGPYRIGYRVVSSDGHPVSGELDFTLTTPGPAAVTPTRSLAAPAPTVPAAGAAPAPAAVAVPTAAPERDGGAPIWPWIVGGVMLVAGGVAAALRLGRS